MTDTKYKNITVWASSHILPKPGLLYRLVGAKWRTKILKFFGRYTVEDELFDTLALEIQHELDRELVERIARTWKANGERNGTLSD